MENEKQRIIIRVGQNTLSFAMADESAPNGFIYEPYAINNSMSMAANLREAFRQSPLLKRNCERAEVIVGVPTLLVPANEFKAENADTYYRFACDSALHRYEQGSILYNVLPNFNAVVIYKLNSDLQLVLSDHFTDVRYNHLMQAVWSHFYAQNFTGTSGKLFAYLHDKRLDVFSFDMSRFRFSNAFEVGNSRDAVYFLLAVWKQLGFDAQNDEIHIVFDTENATTADAQDDRNTLVETLQRYVKKVHTPNVSENLPFDLKILFED